MEQVLATVEVKTSLDLGDLKDICAKASSVGKLQRHPQPEIQLARGMRVTANQGTVLSFGFAYRSSRQLWDICGLLNQGSAGVDPEHRPSAIVVMQDGKGKPGLIVNVEPPDYGTALVSPHPACEFAAIRTDTQGQALLNFYLVLMAWLQHDGGLLNRPDFMAYAVLAGLPRPAPAVIREGASHGKFIIDGELWDPESTSTLRLLPEKFQAAETLTDQEIADVFGALRAMPVPDPFVEGMVFVLDDHIWDVCTPAQVGRALSGWRGQSPSPEDGEVLRHFAALIRDVLSKKRFLAIPGRRERDDPPSTFRLLMFLSPGMPLNVNGKLEVLGLGPVRFRQAKPLGNPLS